MMTRVLITLWPNSEHFRIHFPKIALSTARCGKRTKSGPQEPDSTNVSNVLVGLHNAEVPVVEIATPGLVIKC